MPGIRILEYLPLSPSGAIPPHLQEAEMGAMNGLAVARLCEGLKREGFTPHIMIGHCGWGEVIFVKDVWPNVPLLGYYEFFYRVTGSDLDFDPEFKVAVRNKVIAKQKAQQALNEVQQATYEAQKVVATAQGQARANLRVSQSLTPELVRYTLIQKLAPNLRVIAIPSNAILNTNDLFGQASTK